MTEQAEGSEPSNPYPQYDLRHYWTQQDKRSVKLGVVLGTIGLFLTALSLIGLFLIYLPQITPTQVLAVLAIMGICTAIIGALFYAIGSPGARGGI